MLILLKTVVVQNIFIRYVDEQIFLCVEVYDIAISCFNIKMNCYKDGNMHAKV